MTDVKKASATSRTWRLGSGIVSLRVWQVYHNRLTHQECITCTVNETNSIPENTVWLSYVASRSDDTFPSLEPTAFPSSQDQRQAFKIADTVRFAKSWSAGGVWVYGSGRPETPATGV